MQRNKVAVIYHSHGGNTAVAAELIAEGIRQESDLDVEIHNTDEGRANPALLAECAGAAFGSPDYFSYPAGTMKTFIDDWLIMKRGGNEQIAGMPVALFLTHGGGGAGKEPFGELFRRIGEPVDEVLAVKGRAEGDDADACRALGRKLALESKAWLAERD
ncbi:MAG: hypothetical protein ACOC7T_05885 [Planctomycetota bacterium]